MKKSEYLLWDVGKNFKPEIGVNVGNIGIGSNAGMSKDALAEAKKFKRYYIYYPYYWIKNRLKVMLHKKDFYLLDYKGKFTIISDEVDEMSMEVGRISKKDAIREALWRNGMGNYYGVAPYIGNDKDLLKVYK